MDKCVQQQKRHTPVSPSFYGFRCDENDISTGKAKDPSVPRARYATAQKMRAAISHVCGRQFGLGTAEWRENPLEPGQYLGNPSLSSTVSQYMISLRRRKVSIILTSLIPINLTMPKNRAGEVTTSARAMDQEILKKLYEYNSRYPVEGLSPLSKKRKAEHPEDWGGYKVRAMLEVLYIISFLCLLRYDEALRIRWGDIHFDKDENGIARIRLDLFFRKTHQNGSKHFYSR